MSPGTADISPVRVVLLLVGMALSVVAVVVWGGLAAWSWIIAGIAYQGLTGLRSAAYGAVWQERAAGGLILIFALALLTLIARRTARSQRAREGLTHI